MAPEHARTVFARDAAAPAPADRRAPLDEPAPIAGAATDRPSGARIDPALGTREQPPGLCADRRRATQARDFGLGDAGTERARPCRRTAGTGARRFELAIVPAPTPRHDPRLRLLHCRHGLAAAAVRAVLLAQSTANQALTPFTSERGKLPVNFRRAEEVHAER